jgi:poly-beta-1,6-N-acetyl-D-glucosamine N-deacetylase
MSSLKRFLFKVIRYSGLPTLFRFFLQRKRVTILLFHELSPEVAENNFRCLKKRYNLISLKDYLEARGNQKPLPDYPLIITFDDGHISNLALLPVFRRLKIPATIFLCAGIIDTTRHFWFKNGLTTTVKEALKQVSNQERLYQLAKVDFSPEKQFDSPQALGHDHILKMKDCIDFQAHSVFHPCLPRCTEEEAWEEIAQSKRILEDIFELSINAFAFPNGDYSARDIRLCKEAGYTCALTSDPGMNAQNADFFLLKRLSTNDTANLDELIVRASGVWGILKALLQPDSKNWQPIRYKSTEII